MSRCTKMYQQLRLLEMLNSLACSRRIFPGMMIGFPMIQFSSFYVCIKLHGNIDLPTFAMFPIMYFDGFFLCVVVFTVASRVYKWSDDLLQGWRLNPASVKKSELRKVLRSFPPLKIRMGGNFVETCTPLIIQDFCVRTTASMLLLSNK